MQRFSYLRDNSRVKGRGTQRGHRETFTNFWWNAP